MRSVGLAMPEPPPIEIAPSPGIPDQSAFTAVRRRKRHAPVVHAPSRPAGKTRPVLPGWGRLLLLVGGLALLFVLGTALVAAVGVASFGGAFCLAALLGLAIFVWAGLLLARAGRWIATGSGAVYERVEMWGRVLREVVPGIVRELPVNLPAQLGVADLPVAYSELRALAQEAEEPPSNRALDLLASAIAHLVARDEVILARRTYPLETRGILAREGSTEVIEPVLRRRRIYVGPGALEKKIARALETDRSITVEELVQRLLGPEDANGAQRVIAWVERSLAENPPDLDALAAPDDAVSEFEQYREAIRRADPELYQLLESKVRQSLGAVAARAVPTSVLDLARYTSARDDRSRRAVRSPGAGRRDKS